MTKLEALLHQFANGEINHIEFLITADYGYGLITSFELSERRSLNTRRREYVLKEAPSTGYEDIYQCQLSGVLSWSGHSLNPSLDKHVFARSIISILQSRLSRGLTVSWAITPMENLEPV